ncbi:MAG: hypothetical protein ACPLXP_00180 [Microgenomates group bacterium]
MPVQQHPVPQHIASYEFRLVGDMTLKQFGYLAGGVLVSLFFYGLPLAGFIKWPLILFFGFLGFAFAFMPIEERPLSTWLLAFIKAVFSPTLFLWQKEAKKPEIFEPIARQPAITKAPPSDIQQLSQYLKTLPAGEEKSPLDKKEEEFLQQIANLFPVSQKPATPPKPPVLTFLKEFPGVKEPETTIKPPRKPFPKHPIEFFIRPPQKPPKPTVKAKTSSQLPIPIPPPAPNIVSGMVFDKNGQIVEGAILEIRNNQGLPVRALKTNKLGQFIIATPLENGKYEMEIEKEGLNFDIIKFEAKGEMILPFEIRAK